jgi:hypothetical protein
MSQMHFTLIEATLAGAAITGLTSLVAGISIERVTRTREHLARIWEHKLEVYEYLLMKSGEIGTTRSVLHHGLLDGPLPNDLTQLPKPILDESERRRLEVKLAMFRVPVAVSAAFKAHYDSNDEWNEAFMEYCAVTASSSGGDQIKAESKGAVVAAFERAISDQTKLIVTIQDAIQSTPKRRRDLTR